MVDSLVQGGKGLICIHSEIFFPECITARCKFHLCLFAYFSQTLGVVAIGVVALLCLRRSSDSHRQIDEEVVYMDKLIQVIEEIPDELKVFRSKLISLLLRKLQMLSFFNASNG